MSDRSNSHAREVEDLEEQVDALVARLARIETANDEFISWDMHKRLSAGESAVKVWREHRGMSPTELAAAAGLSEEQLAALEAGDLEPGLRVVARLAHALRLDIDDLVPAEQDEIAAE
jgi:DNA-binding XRE family transcriptional regulator